MNRAVERGQLPAGTCPTQVITQLGAPLYHQLLVTLEPLSMDTADRTAAATAAAARAGVFAPCANPRNDAQARKPAGMQASC